MTKPKCMRTKRLGYGEGDTIALPSSSSSGSARLPWCFRLASIKRMLTIIHIIFHPFFYSSCCGWVLIVTSKWYVLSTYRCHIPGGVEQNIVTYQCAERTSSSELNLYWSCPLLYITTGGTVALLWSLGLSLKCFCKVGHTLLKKGQGYGLGGRWFFGWGTT